jgi:hypothetical protein
MTGLLMARIAPSTGLPAKGGQERTGFIASVKFRKGFFCFFSCPVKKRREYAFQKFILQLKTNE